MDLLQILDSNWFELEADETKEDYESNFRASVKTRRALNLWIQHELSKLDKEMSLSRIKEKPDRAELALVVMARREQLLQMQAILEFKD
ncbi:hypothetical protein [Vibrio phage VpV262]|uniref:Uncharacterized protein n=1 Tax=Vibrio phage VpV262 TaxID=2907796 RepID=Q8LT45_9CAUD|nr:hypothetical protein VpV262p59 [Vibrio phage VpV262]AAM28400.1 hypothetical protein [Vibrio phage VpV262]